MTTRRLLTDDVLEQSGTVANCRMNRERQLSGSNGYQRELGFAPLDLLSSRATVPGCLRWLDLCCGRGIALIEAALAVPILREKSDNRQMFSFYVGVNY